MGKKRMHFSVIHNSLVDFNEGAFELSSALISPTGRPVSLINCYHFLEHNAKAINRQLEVTSNSSIHSSTVLCEINLSLKV